MSKDLNPFIPAWLDDAHLTSEELRVLVHLWRRGKCHSSADTIAAVCRLRRRTVFTILSRLEERGFIRRESRPGMTTLIEPVAFTATGSCLEPVAPNDTGSGEPVAPKGPPPVASTATPQAEPVALNDTGVEPQTTQGVCRLEPHEGTPLKGNPIKERNNTSWPESDVQKIWDASPPKARERSGRAKVAKAWKAIPAGRRPAADAVVTSLELWKGSTSWTEDGGQWIPGLHRWIADEKWEIIPEPAKASKGAPEWSPAFAGQKPPREKKIWETDAYHASHRNGFGERIELE